MERKVGRKGFGWRTVHAKALWQRLLYLRPVIFMLASLLRCLLLVQERSGQGLHPALTLGSSSPVLELCIKFCSKKKAIKFKNY